MFGHACEAHIAYIQAASQGMGCDRHMLGLKLVMEKGESHEIFTHPVFAKSSKWQLSTSALFSSERIMGTGFGAVYHDGYGINYIINPDLIKIGVESKKSDPGTSTDHFCKELEVVLEDLKGMCAEVNSKKPRL